MRLFHFDGNIFRDEIGNPTLTTPGSGTQRLTASQAAVLRYLIHRGNQPARPDQIFKSVWRRLPVGDESHTVETHIASLRKKFGATGRTILATVKGGYQFTPVIAGDPVLAPEDVRPPYCGPYVIEQASREDMIWIAGFTERVFDSADDRPPESTYLEWWTANPTGFSIIKNRHGKRVGNVDMMPLRPDAIERFKAGTLIEHQLKGADFFRPDERPAIKAVYIGSVATTVDRDTAPHEVEHHAADAVLQNLPKLLNRICDPQPSTIIYALAATPKGARLLKACRFRECSYAQDRLDEHDLYCSPLQDCLSGLSVVCRGGLELDEKWRGLLAQARRAQQLTPR